MARESQRNVVGNALQAAAMLVVIVVAARVFGGGPSRTADAEPAVVVSADRPIAQEADVFRTDPVALAVAPATAAARSARQRTLATARALRAYPGAPPHIPHALSEDEFRLTQCGTCHERGGFAPRFGAYTPLTPHPEYANCLQCHVPEQTSANFVAIDWRPAAWPLVGRSAMVGSPPWIPHDLQLRGNCLACHGGPAAAIEIRTTHPERANCRQCHVPAGSGDAEDVFTRPLDGARPGAGDRP